MSRCYPSTKFYFTLALLTDYIGPVNIITPLSKALGWNKSHLITSPHNRAKHSNKEMLPEDLENGENWGIQLLLSIMYNIINVN